jgi:hypothetical protein
MGLLSTGAVRSGMFSSLCLVIAGAKLSVCADRFDIVIVMRVSLEASKENIGFRPDSLHPENVVGMHMLPRRKGKAGNPIRSISSNTYELASCHVSDLYRLSVTAWLGVIWKLTCI